MKDQDERSLMLDEIVPRAVHFCVSVLVWGTLVRLSCRLLDYLGIRYLDSGGEGNWVAVSVFIICLAATWGLRRMEKKK